MTVPNTMNGKVQKINWTQNRATGTDEKSWKNDVDLSR